MARTSRSEASRSLTDSEASGSAVRCRLALPHRQTSDRKPSEHEEEERNGEEDELQGWKNISHQDHARCQGRSLIAC